MAREINVKGASGGLPIAGSTDGRLRDGTVVRSRKPLTEPSKLRSLVEGGTRIRVDAKALARMRLVRPEGGPPLPPGTGPVATGSSHGFLGLPVPRTAPGRTGGERLAGSPGDGVVPPSTVDESTLRHEGIVASPKRLAKPDGVYTMPALVTGQDILRIYGASPRRKGLHLFDTKLRAAVRILDRLSGALDRIDLTRPGRSREASLKSLDRNLAKAIGKLEAQREKFAQRSREEGPNSEAKRRARSFEKTDRTVSDLQSFHRAVRYLRDHPELRTETPTSQFLSDLARAGPRSPEHFTALLQSPMPTGHMRDLSGGAINKVLLDPTAGKVYKIVNEGIAVPKSVTGDVALNLIGRNEFAFQLDVDLSLGHPGRLQTAACRLVSTDSGPAVEMEFVPGRGVRDGGEELELSRAGAEIARRIIGESKDHTEYESNLFVAGLRVTGSGDDARLVPWRRPLGDPDMIRLPGVMRGMTDLQWKDFLRGQIDRHMGNVKIETVEGGYKVWGLDEDMCGGTGGPIPSMPPVVSRDVAEGVLDLAARIRGDEAVRNRYVAMLGQSSAEAFFRRLDEAFHAIRNGTVRTLADERDWDGRTERGRETLGMLVPTKDSKNYVGQLALSYEKAMVKLRKVAVLPGDPL